MSDRNPFVQLCLARLKEFIREPEVVFWVFGFPILLAVGLGIAFRNKGPEVIAIGVVDAPDAARVLAALTSKDGFDARSVHAEEAQAQLRMGKIALVVVPGAALEYRFDPTRPDSLHARDRVDDVLQRAAGRIDPVAVRDDLVTRPGARYIDFLIPGLLGMNLMGGGLWGVGYATVDMRVRKLMKRLLATPMPRSYFLLSMMLSRLLFAVPEIALLLLFARLVFGVKVEGSLLELLAVVILGAMSFMGVGLLVASRAKTMEAVGGLMNLVMMPMYILSGVFFSSSHFPQVVQPFIKALPLTALNDALRAIMMDGLPLATQWLNLLILVAWGGVSFVLALRWFRWT